MRKSDLHECQLRFSKSKTVLLASALHKLADGSKEAFSLTSDGLDPLLEILVLPPLMVERLPLVLSPAT